MSLVESVENIVVSALAAQDELSTWNESGMGPEPTFSEPNSSVVTRDIINAMTDVKEYPFSPPEYFATLIFHERKEGESDE